MDIGMIVARLIHVLAGIFWVGAMLFVTWYLMPALNESGPAGGKVMAAIGRRGFIKVVPVIAILTMLSGIWLYWRISAGFDPVYLRSGPGHMYGTGGILAIVAFVIGMTMSRPAMMKAASLAQSAENADVAEREAMLAESTRQREKGLRAGRFVAWLLLASAVTMAIGRYV
ncbi:MAG: hypothetical protein ACR2GK_05070 [Gemmatimonadaceae bacterium]